jgi:flagellar basal-body rod modification protein FlgD
MSTSSISGVQGQLGQQTTTSDAFNKMDLGQFIKLLVTEMQNQDPMNPMDNSQILQQISQIKAIASNDKMSTTLSSMQLQQNMISGSVLMNQTIAGLTDQGNKVNGVVDKISVDSGAVILHVGKDTVQLKNVSEIDPGA